MHLYLWKMDNSTSFLPQRVAELIVDKGIDVMETELPQLEDYIAELKKRPFLTLTGERREGDTLIMNQCSVALGDENYGVALAQTIGAETGILVTFTPDPSTF